jgi:uncharacterized iron-regulated membrane protein
MKAFARRRHEAGGNASPARLAFMLTGLAAVGLWGGCQGVDSAPTATTTDQTPVAAPVEHPLLKGIPIPTGFALVQERSRARHLGTTREAHCEFQGNLIPSEVVRFYEHYMPTAHFSLGPKVFAQGEYTLRFESATEECNVIVQRKGFKTALIIDIGPTSSSTPPRPSRMEPPPP